jgi:hypothetical protein
LFSFCGCSVGLSSRPKKAVVLSSNYSGRNNAPSGRSIVDHRWRRSPSGDFSDASDRDQISSEQSQVSGTDVAVRSSSVGRSRVCPVAFRKRCPRSRSPVIFH